MDETCIYKESKLTKFLEMRLHKQWTSQDLIENILSRAWYACLKSQWGTVSVYVQNMT